MTEELENYLAKFRHAMSKWPEGLIYGECFAALPECEQMKKDVKLAKRLDADGKHGELLDTFETRVNIQIGHLKAEEGKCFC